jgi:aspartate racemase
VLSLKSIGILGGMGPEATAELYKRLIEEFQSKGSIYDEDFPTIYIYNLPIPSFVDKENDILLSLIEGLEKLRQMGSDILTIPCNTATCIIEKYKEISGFVSIVKETVKKIKEYRYRKVGILSTKLTLKTGIYQYLLKKEGIKIVLPTNKEKDRITRVILNILAGKKLPTDKSILEKIALRMISKGADAIILGCTELPLLFKNSSIRTLDTIQVLTEALTREVYTERKYIRKTI